MEQLTFEQMPLPEGWREIPGFPRYYVNADRGEIHGPQGVMTLTVKSERTGGDYLGCTVQVNGEPKTLTYHEAVCTAHNGPRPKGFQVDHMNKNVNDNRPSNLRWRTRHDNRKRKLSDCKVRNARRKYAEGGITQAKLAKYYGVAIATISHAISGRNWKHLKNEAL